MKTELQGRCLIASPSLSDDNFFRSVVYMVRHDEEESFGLVLNFPTSQELAAVIAMVSQAYCAHDSVLYYGGPVEGPLFALHDSYECSEIDCGSGVYVSSHQEKILDLVGNASARVRLFNGYAGWGPGQLEQEMEMGSWLVTDITAEELFGDPECLWETVVKRIGRQILTENISPRLIPSDPACN